MRPPPIRYPLFWILGACLILALGWSGRDIIARTRATIHERWTRIAEGPPVPSSDNPRRIDETIVARALLLREGVEASDLPNGQSVETIRRRMFVDVYDVWPLSGEPEFLRIGNRRPFGWVKTRDALEWNGRLTLQLSTAELMLSDKPDLSAPTRISIGPEPIPVVDWSAQGVKIAAWKPDQPWEGVARLGWIKTTEVPAEAWSVLLSREEVLVLIGKLLGKPNEQQQNDLRYQAILGRLAGAPFKNETEREIVKRWLPAEIRTRRAPSAPESLNRLARLNETWTTDASWSGTSFHAVPIDAIP